MARLPRHERKILVVGVGDDGPAGLSPELLKRVKRADLLVGGRRHLELFRGVAAERLTITNDLPRLLQQLGRAYEWQRVVVLASGDPCFYGIGPMLAELFGRHTVEIVPHASSVALAFARLGQSWQDATVVSAHGRPLADAVRQAQGATKLAVLTDDANTPGVVAEALLVAGADNATAYVFGHLGGARESERETSLAGLRRTTTSPPLNILVVPQLTWGATHATPARVGVAPAPTSGDDGEPGRELAFGLPESAYAHVGSLITKPEVRAVSLSKLRLRASGVLWDVGAGSGSLGIEAASLVPSLSVVAVEQAEPQRRLLRQNVAATGFRERVSIVAGAAPEALVGLPDPDAVFVGGSGGHLVEILDVVRARLKRGGRIVLNLVTLDHIGQTHDWARSYNVEAEIVQVSVARGVPIVGMVRLQAENPVTVVTLTP
jgi:precorrin-6Y C5,15-methyltransferase (decarboxylating)